MAPFIQFSPPSAFIDPNMIDANGLIPAARRYLTGLRRPGGFRVGQPIRAYDEDGNTYAGHIARVERDLLYLHISVRQPNWELQPSRYVNVSQFGSMAHDVKPSRAYGLSLRTDTSRWVLV